MIFGGPLDGCAARHHAWVEAVGGHERLCEETRKSLALQPAELAANLQQRSEGQYRFIREEALPLGLPEELADKLGAPSTRLADDLVSRR